MALWASSKSPWLSRGDGSVEGTVVLGLLAVFAHGLGACPELLTGVTSLCPHNCRVACRIPVLWRGHWGTHREHSLQVVAGDLLSWKGNEHHVTWLSGSDNILLVFLALSFFAFFPLCLALETPPHPRISQVCICISFTYLSSVFGWMRLQYQNRPGEGRCLIAGFLDCRDPNSSLCEGRRFWQL